MSMTINEIIEQAASINPSGLAATIGQKNITYKQLDTRANQFASVLAKKGLAKNKRIGYLGQDCIEELIIFAAAAKLGAVFVPLNIVLSEPELTAVVKAAKLKLLVIGNSHQALSKLLRDHSNILSQASLIKLAQKGSKQKPNVNIKESDPHVIFFTSGSTGKPKGVVLTHKTNWLRSYPGITPEIGGGTICMFPLFHMAGWNMALICWQSRGTLHLVPPDPAAMLQTAETYNATRFFAIPAIWARIFAHGTKQYNLSSVKYADTGSNATPLELLQKIKKHFPGSEVRVYYGSTETGPIAQLVDKDMALKPGSVGQPHPGIKVAIKDNEICVQGDFLMSGYFKDEPATRESLQSGWYHTGDFGQLDADNYLYVVGRRQEAIRTGAEMVIPGNVEKVIIKHPLVKEVAVVGLPDQEWGQAVTAVVVVQKNAQLSLETLQEYCRKDLAKFEKPRRLLFVTELPKTPATGRIQRNLIVEKILSGSI